MKIIEEKTIQFTTPKKYSILLIEFNGVFSVLFGDDDVIYEFKVSPAKYQPKLIAEKFYNVLINYAIRTHQRHFVSTLKLLNGLPMEVACLHIVAYYPMKESDVQRWLGILKMGFQWNYVYIGTEEKIRIIVRNNEEPVGEFYSTMDKFKFTSALIALPA